MSKVSEYVCGKCGYDSINSTGVFKNNESPYQEGLICFRFATQLPDVWFVGKLERFSEIHVPNRVDRDRTDRDGV